MGNGSETDGLDIAHAQQVDQRLLCIAVWVVADEVRKLAERTTHATTEIAGLVETIRGDSSSSQSHGSIGRPVEATRSPPTPRRSRQIAAVEPLPKFPQARCGPRPFFCSRRRTPCIWRSAPIGQLSTYISPARPMRPSINAAGPGQPRPATAPAHGDPPVHVAARR